MHYDDPIETDIMQLLVKLDKLDGENAALENYSSPLDAQVSALELMNIDTNSRYWNDALLRRSNNPAGALTSCRSYLENVCAHILKENDPAFKKGNLDLHEIVKKVQGVLHLHPDSQVDEISTRVIGNCNGLANGLADLRNKTGDAHGNEIEISSDLSHFIVNITGSLALYFVERWKQQNSI